MAQGAPSLEIGNGDVKEEEAFTFIRKVEVDRSGGILVLDPFATHIAWFDRDGRFIARLGRAGSGPGEFRRPGSMTIDRDHRLHVLDELRHQIVIYALHDTIAIHVEDQQIEGIVRDICAIGNRRFTMTPSDADLVHEIDEHARVIHSFAPAEIPVPDEAGDPRVVISLRAAWNRAVMTCDEASETIVLLHENLPLVRAFTSQGRERWRAVLEDFHGQEFYSTGSGMRLRRTSEDGSMHEGVAVTVTGDRVVATVRAYGSRNPAEGTTQARILSLRTGEELSRITPPARLARVRYGKFYAFEQFPVAKVWRFESGAAWAK